MQDRALLEKVQRLIPIAQERGLTLSQLALAWVLRRPEVTSCIIGASRPSQVEENAQASGVKLVTGVQLLDSYIHDLVVIGDKHNDGAQASGPASNVVVRHNSIINPNHENSGIYLSSNLGPIDGVVIENNFLDGGGRTVYVLDKGTGYGIPTNVSVMNNRFGHDFNRALGFGKFTQAGNAWADSGAVIPDITAVQRKP